VGGQKVFDLLSLVANHDRDVSNPAARKRAQLDLKHGMICVQR
jgi:hypothetical protein